jgi:hypothetical protein
MTTHGGQMQSWQQPIIDTLNLCVSRLPSTIHPAHIERINQIKDWLGNGLSGTPPQPADPAERLLHWTAQEAAVTAETSHGQVIVAEVRTPRSPYLVGHAAERYRASILHSTGAALHSQEPFATFEAAEAWVIAILTQLDDPQLEEPNLESIRFTLVICKRILPDNADPAHLANLQLLEESLVEALL